MTNVATFLMFEGRAEEALDFYLATFPGAEGGVRERFDANGDSSGKVKRASLTLHGQRFVLFDSSMPHAFGFTPAISLFVDFDDESELDNAWARLSEAGQVLMPLDRYDFSRKFGWVQDRFGVSWQLNLA